MDAEHLTFSVGGSAACTTFGTNVAFPCDTTGKIPARGSGQAAVVKATWQPFENLQYYATFGTGRYSLQVASVSATTSLTGDLPGWIGGAGVRGLLFPESVVTPALAVDASVGLERYSFNRSAGQPTAALTSVKDRLDLMRLQLALETSRTFKVDERWKVEPYGGLKWVRTQVWLKDLDTGSRAGGIHDTVTPYAGVNLPVSEHESFFGEASFVNGYEYAAGLTAKF
ncbi:MAG: autotransporter domain-containing protein [Elusimicrobia bacterium]|nr:autotransporter domain-containing protein [Elusimicrobiota bacterium]